MDEQQAQTLLTLARGIVMLADELRKVRTSLTSLEVVVAGILNPANSKDALQYIGDQDKVAQTLASCPEIEQVRLVLDTLAKNQTLGRA